MKRSVTAALCFIVLLASCRYREISEPSPFVHEIAVGEKFRINLPENHEKKELWTLTKHDDKVITHLNDVWHGNQKGIDFNFFAEDTGSTQIKLVKRHYKDTVETVNFWVKITDN